MTIKEKEVAFLKTTGEPVFVLAIEPNKSSFKQYSFQVEVNRPLTGQDGIQHSHDTFFLEELESLEDQQARFISERQKVMDKFGPKTEQSPSQDAGFPIN